MVFPDEIIEVAFLRVYAVFSPSFTIAKDLVNGRLLIVIVVVCSGKVFPMPLHLGVFVAAARKGESKPCIDLVWIADCLCSIVAVNLLGATLFKLVRCSLVVQHCVENDANVVFLRLFDKAHKVLFRTPFGFLLALLVEFAKIPQVINVVAVAVFRRSFACRRYPHGSLLLVFHFAIGPVQCPSC
jgi:hypothetical protein